MRILYQGGWKEGRDPLKSQEKISEYCKNLAKHVINNKHEIVLTSPRHYDKIIADEISAICKEKKKNIKDFLLYLLPDRIKDLPTEGRVKIFEGTRWWIEERTYLVQNADALIAIGGGKGTFDCVEKAFLAGKPVFVASAIDCQATNVWKRRKPTYKYLRESDSEIFDDVNITPDEFFENVFKIINSLAEFRYSRNIFIVHGRDNNFKDSLVTLLKELEFEPIVLQDEPSKSLTIIEKLERDTGKVGFSFVLYTPDDEGYLKGKEAQYRARQNVIFEHGLLIGLLGRDRTCAIIKGKLEFPSDIQGMIYEHIENFKKESLKIAKILKQAGYKIDLSKLV